MRVSAKLSDVSQLRSRCARVTADRFDACSSDLKDGVDTSSAVTKRRQHHPLRVASHRGVAWRVGVWPGEAAVADAQAPSPRSDSIPCSRMMYSACLLRHARVMKLPK